MHLYFVFGFFLLFFFNENLIRNGLSAIFKKKEEKGTTVSTVICKTNETLSWFGAISPSGVWVLMKADVIMKAENTNSFFPTICISSTALVYY